MSSKSETVFNRQELVIVITDCREQSEINIYACDMSKIEGHHGMKKLLKATREEGDCVVHSNIFEDDNWGTLGEAFERSESHPEDDEEDDYYSFIGDFFEEITRNDKYRLGSKTSEMTHKEAYRAVSFHFTLPFV